MKIEELYQLHLPHDKKTSRLKAASFDQLHNRIALGFRKEIIEFDISTGSKISQFSTESEITHLAHAYTENNNVLVASLRNGCFSVIDLNTRTLSAFHIPTKTTERTHASVFAISRTRSLIFYSRVGSSSVTGIEIFRDSKNSANYPHKKQITALTVHPNKSVMCSASIDGLIKIWETETHTATAMFEETLDKKLKSAVTALCFHRSEAKKTTDILVTGTKSGRVQVWAVTPDAPPRVIGATNLSQWITSIFFHPTLPCFFVLTAKGCLRAISVNHILNAKDIPTMKGLLSDFDMIQPLYVPLEDTTYRTNTKNLKTLLPVISATINEKNGQIAFFGKNFKVSGINTNITPTYYPIHSLMPTFAFAPTYPLTLTALLDQEEFTVPTNAYFVENVPGGALISNWAAVDEGQQSLQLVKPSQSFDPMYRITATRFSSPPDSVLIFYERASVSSYTQAGSRFQVQKVTIKGKASVGALVDGIDGGWLNDRYLILHEDGQSITLYSNGSPETIPLSIRAARVFCFNANEGTVIYHNATLNALGYATTDGSHKFQFNNYNLLHLREGESMVDLQYQQDSLAGSYLGCITTQRVMILSTDLKILASMESNSNRKLAFNSIIWCGNALLFNSVDTLYSIAPGTTATSIATLPPTSKLIAVMPDRIVFATQTSRRTKINTRYFSIAEVAFGSILSIPNADTLKHLRIAVQKFDCRTISSKTLAELETHGFADLASEIISQSVYNFSWELRFKLAKSSLNLTYAFDIIKKQFLLEANHGDHVAQSSPLYSLFQSLAELSLDYGQFEIAEKCYDILNDCWSLFNLYSLLQYQEGLEQLSERCKINPDLYEIYMACQVSMIHCNAPPTGTLPIMNWQIQVENQNLREFNDIGSYLKGTMRTDETKAELAPLDQSNLNRWMGQGINSGHAATNQPLELKLDQAFGQEFGRGEASSATSLQTGEDSDTVSTDTDTTPKHARPKSTPTDEQTQDDEKSEAPLEVDEEGFTIRNDQNDARKKFQESSSDDSSDDEVASSLKKKKKALRNVRIDIDKVLHEEASADAIRKNLGSLGGLGLPAPGGGASNARRRQLKRGNLTEESSAENTPNSTNASPQGDGTSPPETVAPKIRIERPVLVNVKPSESLKEGVALIEKSKYKEARPKINEAIEQLSKDSSEVLKKSNVLLCTQYKLLVNLLLNISKLEAKQAKPMEIARCAALLPQTSVAERHRIVCRNVSVKRNTEAGNYGIAGNVLKELERLAPPQFKEDVRKKISMCEEKEFQNADKELEEIMKRDNGIVKFCWKTLEWIEESHLECPYCNALFNESDTVDEDDKCSYCLCGELVKKNSIQ